MPECIEMGIDDQTMKHKLKFRESMPEYSYNEEDMNDEQYHRIFNMITVKKTEKYGISPTITIQLQQISFYKDIFNIRLALDKVIEHWKSRMLFFRVNKTTIEVIERKNEDDSQDSLWGLAWEVESIEEAYKRLISEGVDVTPIKEGLKENTLVATIKSHTHNVPTLLIEHT